ncbi:hypothetical protein FRC17_001543 [Serendipita sp. 399]|nr:hypothetical protein FRC17_001543 [Serendipita sp. 399]
MSSTTDAELIGIQLLPAELLLQIFTPLCLDTDSETRWILVAVCSQWRRIFLTTPALWKTIQINSSKWTDSKAYDRFLERVETQIRRSGSNQLYVRLDVKPVTFPEPPSSMWRFRRQNPLRRPDFKRLVTLFEQIAPFSTWRVLDLVRCDKALFDEMQLARIGGFTNLEMFLVQDLDDPLLPLVNSTVTDMLKRFEYLPTDCPVDGKGFVCALSNILLRITTRLILPCQFNGSTEGLHLPPNITRLALFSGGIPDADFPHVQTINMLTVDAGSMISLATQFSNLKSLTLSISYVVSTSVPLEFPRLEHITTHMLAYTILTHITAPNLQTLCVFLSSQKTAMPSWMGNDSWRINVKDLVDPVSHLANLSPQKDLVFLLPVSHSTLREVLSHCGTKAKHLGILFVQDLDPEAEISACTVLASMFRSMDGYLGERTRRHEPEFWELCPNLERLGLVLDCKMDETMGWEWDWCASRFLASRSDTWPLKMVQAMWSCREKRKVTAQ